MQKDCWQIAIQIFGKECTNQCNIQKLLETICKMHTSQKNAPMMHNPQILSPPKKNKIYTFNLI